MVIFFSVALIPTVSFAQWWNPFAPSDYEECAESAAKSAKTNEALKVLISTCASKFAGRRKVGGGYSYFDARQDRTFDIKGPNPTPDELKFIDFQREGVPEEGGRATLRQSGLAVALDKRFTRDLAWTAVH